LFWDDTRELALRRLRVALENYEIAGLQTNIDFLIRLSSHSEFKAGNVHTGFIPKHAKELGLVIDEQSGPREIPHLAIAYAHLSHVLQEQQHQQEVQNKSLDPFSPWAFGDGYRVNHNYKYVSEYKHGDAEKWYKTTLVYNSTNKSLNIQVTDVASKTTTEFQNITGTWDKGRLHASVNGVRHSAVVAQTKGGNIEVIYSGKNYVLVQRKPNYSLKSDANKGSLIAPMPGKVVKVFVKAGSKVKQGEPLLILEAMKMEHKISSPKDGSVKIVHYAVGDLVEDKANLVTIE